MPPTTDQNTDQALQQPTAEAMPQPPTAGTDQEDSLVILPTPYSDDALRQDAGPEVGDEPHFERALARLLHWLSASGGDRLALLVKMAAIHKDRRRLVPQCVGPTTWAWAMEVSR